MLKDFSKLEKFPKTRERLPSAFEAIYDQHYKENRDGGSKASGLAQNLEKWMHEKVSSDPAKGQRILEIGAGTLNHVKYQKDAFLYDVIEPYKLLYLASNEKDKVNKFYSDISEINEAESYDRIISIATFEHILDLPKVVAKSVLLLREGGQLKIAIPSEGSLLWYMGWKFTTGIEFYIRHRLNYSTLMKYEHVNTWKDVNDVLQVFFGKVECESLGVSQALSFYQYYNCSDPQIDTANNYLEKYNYD
ncbi:MAG: methyltransferase domain-containing protein [Halioglobus sp.]